MEAAIVLNFACDVISSRTDVFLNMIIISIICTLITRKLIQYRKGAWPQSTIEQASF